MRWVLWCLIFAAGLAVVHPSAIAASTTASGNALTNGDFEFVSPEADARGRLPVGWEKGYGHTSVLQIAPETRPGSPGKQCLKIDCNDQIQTSGVYSALFAIDPSRALQVSGWMKPGHSERGLSGTYFGIGWFDRDRKPIILVPDTQVNYHYMQSTRQEGARHRLGGLFLPAAAIPADYYCVIPATAAFAQIMAFTINYPAPVLVDDIEVIPLTPEELRHKRQELAKATPPPAGATAASQPPQEITSDWAAAWLGGGKARDAANELARYMAKVLGVSVASVEWKPNAAKHNFVITDVAHAPSAVAKGLEGKHRDAFAIECPVRFDGKDVCLLVSQDEYAHDYPVYYFLTKFMDVHWVGPGELGVVYEKKPDWKMPAKISVVENPDFEMRLWSGQSFSSREWLARSGRMGFHHALGYVFHPDKFGDIPEVYPLVGGRRFVPKPKSGAGALSGWQPCTGNPKSVDIAVDHVLQELERGPAISVSLSVNDGAGNTCECDLCRAQDEKDAFQPGQRPNLSGRFFRFYNAVMERVLEKNPNAYIAVLGYGAVKTPPKEFKVHPRIQVFQVQPSIESLRAWKEAGATPNMYLWLWDGGFLTVRPDMHVIAELVRECHRLGGLGLYSEIVPQWTVSAPKFYILAHLLWDTNRDVDQLLDEYLELAYGKDAAVPLRAFFDKWYEIWNRRPAAQRHET